MGNCDNIQNYCTIKQCSFRDVFFEDWSTKWFYENKLRHEWKSDELLQTVNDDRSGSHDLDDHESRHFVPVGSAAPVVSALSSELLLSPQRLSIPSYEHLLMKFGSVGVGKPAAATDTIAASTPCRRRVSDAESDCEVSFAMTTTSTQQQQQQQHQHHLLLDLQQRLQSTCMYTATGK